MDRATLLKRSPGAIAAAAALGLALGAPLRAHAREPDCLKRGVLGKCEAFGIEPASEGDKEERAPGLRSRIVEGLEADAASQDAKYRSKIAAETTADDASPLIAKLRAQTAANAEKNALAIEMKNFENSQAGDFGPMRRFYPVKKRDGTFAILTQRQFDQLSDEKKIKNKMFVDDKWVPKDAQSISAPKADASGGGVPAE